MSAGRHSAAEAVLAEPERLLPALHHFLDTTTRFRYTETRWRQVLAPTTVKGATDRGVAAADRC